MSVKRVFAIIGIVVGCIAAFVGGVIGVMALMGKFKTPVVKPEKLYFENPEQVVVAQYKDDDGKDVIYSFNLKAENNSIDYPVNVKECFIWFEKGVGEDLIQLCDKDGNLLKADSKKRYAVNCNETLYFKIKVFHEKYEYNSSTWSEDCKKLFIIQDGKYVLNESEEYDSSLTYYTMQTYEEKYTSLDLESLINGKVVLRARTADETVQTGQDLVVWIDRNVSSIFLNYGDIPSETSEKSQVQRVNIGVDKEVEFNYVVNPEISLQPISKESKKIVELYYNDPKSEDFVLVNIENIKNTTKYSLHKIFDETKCYVDELTGELKLVFLSSDATNGTAHYFKIAIFPSYNARAEFLADENNSNVTNVERLQHMVSTDLYVQVVNINIDKVTLSDGELNLNLFTDNNVVYLRNEDAETLNLNVEMFAGTEKLEVRFDELDFKTITDNISTTHPKFVAEQTVEVNEINFSECSDIIFSKEGNLLSFKINEKDFVCTVDSTLLIGDYAIINKITDLSNNVNYYCNNGVALVYTGTDSSIRRIKMLEVDSYLDFYVYDNINETYTLAKEYTYDSVKEEYVGDITYSVTPDGQHSSKNWQIVVKDVSPEILRGEKTLVLGLLVVNDEGKFTVDDYGKINLFAIKPVTINVQELHYNVKNSAATLDLFVTTDDIYPYETDEGLDFDYFINILEGSYNACLFVVSQNELYKKIDGRGYSWDVVDNLHTFRYVDDKGTENTDDDELYYVVGYLDRDDKFVNKVRTYSCENLIYELAENKLQMLQLKNVYGETTSEVVSRLVGERDLNSDIIYIEKENVVGLYKTNISIKQKLVVEDGVQFKVLVDDETDPSENPTGLYSGTSHTITITTPSCSEIITRICNFYGIVKADGELDTNYILNTYPQNARIKGRLIEELENEALEIALDVGELLSSDVKVEINLANVFTGVRTEETLYSFNIVNSAPTSIVYNGKDLEGNPISSITLAENQASAPEVTAEITWENNNYKYNWYINYEEEGQKEINEITLNKNLSVKEDGSIGDGFQDPVFKVVQGITYGVSNSAISIDGTSLVVNGITDNTYLSVTIAGVTRYLKLNVVQVGFTLTQTNLAIDKEVGYLNDSGIVDYKFDGTSVYNNAINDIKLTNINVLYTNSKAGTLKVYETERDDGEGNKIYTYPYTYKYEFEDGSSPLTILTITKDTDKKDWKFTREDDKYATLSVSFNVVTKTNTLNCSIKFTSGIEHEYNASAWGITPKLYQNTEILLYEIKTDDGAFANEPLIKIRNTSGKTITVETNKGSFSDDYVLILSELGEYNITIKANGEKIEPTLSFTVVPNIVVKQNTATNLIVDSGNNDAEKSIFAIADNTEYIGNVELFKYNSESTCVYGKNALYSDESKLIKYTKDLKSLVTMQSKEGPEVDKYYVFTDGTIKTAWIDLIGEMQEVNVVVSSGAYEVGTFTAIVKNNNTVSTTATITPENVLNLKAMLDYVNNFKIADAALKDLFTLTEIKWAYSDEHNNGTYPNTSSKIPTLNVRYKNVSLILTFKEVDGDGELVENGKTLVFNGKTFDGVDLTINVVPFELKDITNIEAYSEKQFNLLTGVYNTADIDAGKKIEAYFNYIKVLSVKDENGNDLTNLTPGSIAYNYANPSNGLTITFDKLYADSVKAFIEYEVQYVGSTETYIYKKEITLQNWQDLSVKYPENEADDDEDKYLFVEEITLSNGVKYENKQYEAVVIDNSESYTIDLKDIQNKNICRITAKDRTSATAEFSTNYEIESLEILAYENTINFPSYVKAYGNIVISKENGTITFKNYGQNFSGIIVFKLTTTSGNSVEYFVRVTCLGGKTEVSGTATGFINGEYTGNSVTNIVSAYSGFKNKFGVDYDARKVKMFLLDATVLASDYTNYAPAIFNDIDEENPIRYTCVNDKTLTILDYTTITLSLIYYDSNNGYVYPIGILTLYLRPTVAKIDLDETKDGVVYDYDLANDQGIKNGEFEYTIPANTTSVPLPTDFEVAKTTDADGKLVSYILNSNGELVDYIEGIEINSNISIINQVTSAKVFTVFYSHEGDDNYTIKVTYTLIPVDINAGSTHTIGELNKEKTKFVDTFVIDAANYEKYFGTYQGKITIGDVEFNVGKGINAFKFVDGSNNVITTESGDITTDGKVTYSITDGVLTLEFEQGLYDKTKEIDVYYTNLNDSTKQKQTYTFNVKSGLYIEKTEGDNSGLNSNQRKTTEIGTINYTSHVGSQLGITKSDIYNGVIYKFAGYTIYIKDYTFVPDDEHEGKIKFEIKEEDTVYVTSDNGQSYTYNAATWSTDKNKLYLKDAQGNYTKSTDQEHDVSKTYYLAPWIQEFNGSDNIGFVHMPTNGNKNINISFTISNDAGEFRIDASTVDTRTLYLTLAKTYQQVEAIYLTKDATAENVVKGTTKSNLQNYLFESINIPSDIANTLRLKLKDVNGNDVDSGFAGMGFTDSSNPNFINFTKDASAKATLTLNANNTQNIVFDDSITANEPCIIYLNNVAGMSGIEYKFQIMADDKVDGFTFSTEGHPDKTTTATPVDYMSFVIREDNDANAEYSTGKLKIGTIKDGLSKGVYVLNGSNWEFLPKATTEGASTEPIGVEVKIPANSQDNTNEEKITCSYVVILEMDPYNNANYDIYIKFDRPVAAYRLPDKTEFTLNIHGTSGYILENLQVVLFNAEVGPKDENRQSVYGGETVALSSVIDAPSNASFELVEGASMVGESGYAINTPLSSYKYDTDKNSLIEFNSTTNILTTKTVGKNVNINLVFKVKIDGYYLNNVTYQIQLLRSLQFFFNGEEPVITNGEWKPNSVTSYATNFVLTNYDNSKTPPTTTFAGGMNFSFNVKMSNNKEPSNGELYFKNLLFELEDCVGGQAAGINIIKDPTKTNPDDSILKVDNTGITFYKDYTGKLYLNLTAGLRNGFNYTVSWTIDVFGILDIQPQNKTDNEGLTSSSMPYDSGQSVDLLNNDAGDSTGLYLKDMEYIGDSKLFDDYINYDENTLNNDNKLQATYQYAIVNPYDERYVGLNNQERFDKFVDDGGILLGNTTPENVTNRTINIPLPVVPRTGSEENYLVIYKVNISYLGYTSKTYYVAYKVVNNLNISITDLKHGDGTAFDADNINVSQRLVTGDDGATTYLDLFYYTETYTHTTNGANPVTTNYIIRLGFNEEKDKAVYQAKIDGGTFEEVQIEPTSNANQLLLSKDDGETWITITKSTVSTETESYWIDVNDNKTTTDTSDDIIENASLFTLNFNNITEFAKFINEIDGIVIKQPTVEYIFTLTHIAEGRWGIDLTSKEKKEEGGSFVSDIADLFKNKLEDAEFIIRADSGQTIYPIPEYDAQTKTGFRMHTSSELVAAGKQKFNDLFARETVTNGWLKYQYIDIIGVYKEGTPSANWVTSTNGTAPQVDPTIETITDVTIDVPTGNGSTTIRYTLQKVRYFIKDGGVAGVCALEQYFYVVNCEDYDAVYKMNLNPESIELYKQGEDTIVNLRNYFVKYKNNDDDTSENYGKLEIDENALVTDMSKTSGADIKGSPNGNTYVITEDNLIAYRNAHLNDGNVVTITYTAKFGDVEDMRISINYQLPSLPGVVVNQNSLTNENSNVSITSIYVPVYNGTTTVYQPLKNTTMPVDNLPNVTSIVENGSNYTAEDGFIKDETTKNYTGYIELDKVKVDAYFASNANINALEIKYTITTRTNDKTEEMNFVIVVRRGSAPTT